MTQRDFYFPENMTSFLYLSRQNKNTEPHYFLYIRVIIKARINSHKEIFLVIFYPEASLLHKFDVGFCITILSMFFFVYADLYAKSSAE